MGDYKIVNAKGLRFLGKNNVVAELTAGFCLYEVNHGFVSFKDTNEENGVKTPYLNKKEVLQEIIDNGGLTDFSQMEWLHAINWQEQPV